MMVEEHETATVAGDDAGPVSKSQRKRESTALQDLGEALVALSADRLARMELPEALRAAVDEARRIRKFGALRRQMQYIGRVMRDLDPAPIRAQFQALEGQSRAHTAWLHRVERWRERLLADDEALGELMARHPGTDAQHLRSLVRAARHETAAGKPPRAFRQLFRVLRDLIPEPAGSPAPASEENHDHES